MKAQNCTGTPPEETAFSERIKLVFDDDGTAVFLSQVNGPGVNCSGNTTSDHAEACGFFVGPNEAGRVIALLFEAGSGARLLKACDFERRCLHELKAEVERCIERLDKRMPW